jgi:DNA-binding MarR family transcriptional regulator
MLVLWESDGPSVSDLGERLFLDSGTLTPLLKRMEQAGLLQRKRSTEDERRVHVFVTSKGGALREMATAIPICLVQRSGQTLSEIHALTQQIQSLRTQLASS